MHDGNVIRRVLDENVRNMAAYQRAAGALKRLEEQLAYEHEEKQKAQVLATNLFVLLEYPKQLRLRLADALSEPVSDPIKVAERVIQEYIK